MSYAQAFERKMTSFFTANRSGTLCIFTFFKSIRKKLIQAVNRGLIHGALKYNLCLSIR